MTERARMHVSVESQHERRGVELRPGLKHKMANSAAAPVPAAPVNYHGLNTMLPLPEYAFSTFHFQLSTDLMSLS